MSEATTVQDRPQMALGERVMEDEELLDLLEKRQRAKEARAPAVKAYQTADAAVKGYIERLGLPDGSQRRLGRFVFKVTQLPEQHVEFDSKATTRISISTPKQK